MSDENGSEENYSIYKSETTSVQDSKEVQVKAPTKKEAEEMFEEAWE